MWHVKKPQRKPKRHKRGMGALAVFKAFRFIVSEADFDLVEREHLVQDLQDCGGRVVPLDLTRPVSHSLASKRRWISIDDDGDDDDADQISNIVYVGARANETPEYLVCLAARVPCVNTRWVSDCLASGSLQTPLSSSYLLSRGRGIVQTREQLSPETGGPIVDAGQHVRVEIVGGDRLHCARWSAVYYEAGCHVVNNRLISGRLDIAVCSENVALSGGDDDDDDDDDGGAGRNINKRRKKKEVASSSIGADDAGGGGAYPTGLYQDAIERHAVPLVTHQWIVTSIIRGKQQPLQEPHWCARALRAAEYAALDERIARSERMEEDLQRQIDQLEEQLEKGAAFRGDADEEDDDELDDEDYDDGDNDDDGYDDVSRGKRYSRGRRRGSLKRRR